MKYHQYAYVPTDRTTALQELQDIHFLPQDYQSLSFGQLLAHLVGQTLVEATSPAAKIAKLAEFATDDHTSLAAFIAASPINMTPAQFYAVGLQLLGYHPVYDYDLNTPVKTMTQHALPVVSQIATTADLIQAFYRLLNTRSKNGQTLIDVMAGKGYFLPFVGEQQWRFFNGKSLPVFDTSKVIREVVYVASDLDSDEDGQSDLMQVTIFRPAETAQGLKVPALYTACPYFSGIIDNEKDNHNVDENLTDATQWDNPRYEAKPHAAAPKPGTEKATPTETALYKSSYPLNEYMLARGFASVFAGTIGTRSSDGLRITGAPEETESAKAVIEWLHGDRIAYTDRTCQHETKADWCNHQIGMTGRSYLGTLQIAVATTGVAGLKTVISEAAISSWYDYYREHGLVIAPEACQGEDLDKLAETCQSNLWDGGLSLRIRPRYEAEQKLLQQKQDRVTGQYSDFWEARNYRHHTDGIKCSWISVHGLNDWNVKPKNVYKIWQKVKELPIKHHLFLHQGPHHNMNNLVSIDFTDLMNLWLCHELLNQDNPIEQLLPTALIQDNLAADCWHSEDDWADDLGQPVTYYPAADGGLAKDGNDQRQVAFVDEGGQAFKQAKISEAAWQYQFICGDEPWAKASLRFETDSFIHPVTLVGRPEIHLKVSASLPKGQLSVALVELGTRKRLTPLPRIQFTESQELGYRFGTDRLQEFMPDKATKAKLITKAHMNLQNYQDMKRPVAIKANTFYDLTFKLQPTYYTLPAGSKLCLIIYATDQGMTKRPLENDTYTIDLGQTELHFNQK